MSELKKYSVGEINFKGDTTVTNSDTGEVYKGQFNFIGKGFEVDNEKRTITFTLDEDIADTWSLLIFDEEDYSK